MLTDSVIFLITSHPSDIKGGVEAPLKGQVHNYNHHINFYEQYKNNRCRAIILRKA
jgi:hypothetical protein